MAIWFIDKLGRKPLLLIGTSAMAIALSMATFAFYKASYEFNDATISKIENLEIRIELNELKGTTYYSQKELFAKVEPMLSENQFQEFRTNELKHFISINAVLVLIAILLYVAAFAISLGPVMWTMLSEIFPGNVKGIAISIVGFFNSLVSYSVTQLFPWELTNLGPTLTFALYAGLAVLSILFVAKYVIETKGKTLEEVQELLIKA